MEYPIRVLHVFYNLDQGGIQNFIMNVYRNIDRNKIQFDFLMHKDGYFDNEVISLGGKVYKIDSLKKIGQFKYKKELENFFNEHKEYKIIHSHYNQLSGIILEVAKKCDIPVRIAHSHSTKNSNKFISKIYKRYVQSKINKNATHFFACSEEAAKWLFKDKFEDAIIINNGIDIEKFKYSEQKREKIRQELNIDKDTRVIGNISRFSKVKNHEFIIDIFNEYLKSNKNSLLVLVGSGGNLEQNIKDKVEKLNLDSNVKFLGIRTDTDYLYSAFDCFIVPSLYEGIPLTLIEAQANGLPIIASNNIDKKVKLSNNIIFEDLQKKEKWLEDLKGMNRENTDIKEIEQSGYNIKVEIEKIEEIYSKVLEE